MDLARNKQNISHAVMSQRAEARDSLDNFPTPPWATRALLEHVIERGGYASHLTCLEPACGAGHMSKVLKEYFKDVRSADAFDYGYGHVEDFLSVKYSKGSWDWVITNPPFRLAEDFILEALPVARRGVAMLVRTVFIESVGRYERIFSQIPPTSVAQFVERVPMVKGRLDSKASTATGYAWIVWDKNYESSFTQMKWIPPCRKRLEKDGDYHEPLSSSYETSLDEETPTKADLLL
ncbi:SAM-dependent methyltransferase [Oricola indica]|uniref:SAM-dependent methyltransferase n=1 Tax=Oricola indica TaxID=2872591 RepID=UPI001CBFCC17|nr:SAM-dependent methyltransferase [Oricola indica]